MKPAVLIVDDDAPTCAALAAVLEPLEIRTDQAGSATEALRLLLANDYAVALLDVRMPEINGFELAALMRERSRTADTPIIFITAADDIDPLKGYDLGAVDFLTPPIIPHVLRSKVRVFLQLARLLEHQKQLSEAKTEFLALAAHELRSPLTVASGYLSLIMEGNLGPAPERWEEALRIIEMKLGELRLLSDDLIESARVENQTLEPRFQTLDLRDLARAAVNRARPRARMLSGEIELLTPLEPVMAEGDPKHIARILDNLLQNALAYGGENPAVTVKVGPDRSIRVIDAGPGVRGFERDRIFARFYRSDGSKRAHPSGTGLGLYLSRELARANGGDVVLESTSESGSAFAVTLPGPAPLPRATRLGATRRASRRAERTA